MYSVKDSVLALLAEADTRISDFEGAARSYSATSCRVVRDDDLQIGKAHYRLQDVLQPPISFSVKILGVGEYLRSPLDHIVSSLVANSDILPAAKNPAFPICVNEKEWKDAAGKIKGLKPRDEIAVRALQPFEQHNGGDPEGHPLALLQSLNNLTKHSIVLFTQVAVAQSNRHRIQSGYRISWSELFNAPFENGAEVGVLVPGKTTPEDRAVFHQMSSRGKGSTTTFGTGFGVFVSTGDEEDDREEFVPGQVASKATSERLNAGLERIKRGDGPWEQAAWDDFFANVEFELKLAQTILFGPGTKRLENLPVLETIRGIRRYLHNNVFQKGGLIERLV